MRTDPKLVQNVLSLLSEWGWETGIEKLKAWISAAEEGERVETQFFIGWMAGERGAHQEALSQLEVLRELPELSGWALVGQSYVALRQSEYGRAHDLLRRAADQGGQDPVLRATIAHCEGAVFYHEGKTDQALHRLHNALGLFGREHFGTGRVYDTLGMCYASKNNFHAAREFYDQSIKLKRKFNDEAGVALSHGQLGRLYLDWGHLLKAEEHFNENLEISRRIHDERGVALMYNALGQVALAREAWDEAGAWLDHSIRFNEAGHWRVPEAFARKDRAVAHLMVGRVDKAEAQARRAQELFTEAEFPEGVAHVNRVWGMIYRFRKLFDESEQALRKALAWFDGHQEDADATRTQLEMARTMHAREVPFPLVTRELLKSLDQAEACRRDALVRDIEAELREGDELAYCRRVYRRARGREVQADTSSLLSGERDEVTVLFLDIQGSTEFARGQDPEVFMMTLNQMMATFAKVLSGYRAIVTAYLGDGFMALLRGIDHPKRAVRASLALVKELQEFNQPREVLGLQTLKVRIGVSTGAVFIGNVGTYEKMDYTAIGTTVNLAARIQNEGLPGIPCVSRTTYEQVREQFAFRDDNPRRIDLKGLGGHEVWDVIEERRTSP